MEIKIKLVLITILLISFQTIIAQEQQSTGAIPNMKVEKTHRIVTVLDNPASIAYAHNSQGGATLSMPIPAGTPWTTIGSWTAPNFGSSMIKGGDGNYYITDLAPTLFQFNTGTGAVTQLGAITGTNGDQINGITYNPANSQYYLLSATNFYSFDIVNYTATLIGSMGIAGSLFIDLAFNFAGVCYAYDLTTDAAYNINPSTGVATLLGPLGYDANFGQGMSCDMETNTIYLSAFNNGTFTGQLRTMNPATGLTTLVTDWGLNQLAPFALDTQYGPPCPVGAPSNPNPPNGATGLPRTGNTLSWINGTGTTNVEVWFGPYYNVVKVYDGPIISSYALSTLTYDNIYNWYVVCKNDTCGTEGPTWTFTTIMNLNSYQWCEAFNHLNNWTIVGPLGQSNWSASPSNSAGGTLPELRMSWTPSFNGESKIRSISFPMVNNYLYGFSFNFYFDWFANPSGSVTVGITFDGGVTSSIFYSLVDPTGNVGPTLITGTFYTPSSGSQNAQIEITFIGNSFNNDNIYLDNVCIDGEIPIYPPNAPGNLTAQVIPILNPQVQLNWQDNSGNESGFNIVRKKGYPNDPGEFIAIDTVLNNITQYIDTSVIKDSTYSYRVFAFNQWGQNGSDTVTITVSVPVGLEIISDELPNEFALHQNYPNPFNPSTKIKYTIPTVETRHASSLQLVTLKIYDILGNEVATLVNEEQAPGVYEVEFNTSSSFRLVRNLVSGIYFYQLKISGPKTSSGQGFVETKKMILLK